MSLGAELKRIREEIGLTLGELTEGIGIYKEYLRLMERGKRNNVSFMIICKISETYQVPLDYFNMIEHQPNREIPVKVLNQWYYQNEALKEMFISGR